jgi:hypothetical protein
MAWRHRWENQVRFVAIPYESSGLGRELGKGFGDYESQIAITRANGDQHNSLSERVRDVPLCILTDFWNLYHE